MLVVLIDDAASARRAHSAGPVRRRRRAARREGAQVQPLSHDRPVLADPAGAADRRNHHAVGMGGITEIATSAPGYNSIRPNTAAPLAETLKLNGYSTAQFGKCHEVPVWETSPMGPFEPGRPVAAASSTSTASSAGRRTSTRPAIYDGTVPIEQNQTPEEGYHFTEDMTDQRNRPGSASRRR